MDQSSYRQELLYREMQSIDNSIVLEIVSLMTPSTQAIFFFFYSVLCLYSSVFLLLSQSPGKIP